MVRPPAASAPRCAAASMPSASPLVMASPARRGAARTAAAVSRPSGVGLRLPTIASCGRPSACGVALDEEHQRRVGNRGEQRGIGRRAPGHELPAAARRASARPQRSPSAGVAAAPRSRRGRDRARRARRAVRARSAAAERVAAAAVAGCPACRPGARARASQGFGSSMKRRACRDRSRQALRQSARVRADYAPRRSAHEVFLAHRRR